MSSRRKDHYEALGVSRDADQEEIRSAYRRKAKAHHPDLCDGNSGDPEAFREAQHAYETLRDPTSRRAYDRRLHRHEAGGGFGSPEDEDQSGGSPPGGFSGGAPGGFRRSGGGAGRWARGQYTSPTDELHAMFEELFGAAFGGGPFGGFSRGGFGGFGGATRQRDPEPDWMYSDEGTDAGRYEQYQGPVEFDVHMSPDEAFTGVTAHLHLDGGGTVVVDIPPGVRDGRSLRAHFKDRSAIRELILNIHIV